jgi:hypothetical protein
MIAFLYSESPKALNSTNSVPNQKKKTTRYPPLATLPGTAHAGDQNISGEGSV